MFYYYPFEASSAISDTNLVNQINLDIKKFNFNAACETLYLEWTKNEVEIISRLNNLNTAKITTLICVPTLYGPYGYYYNPDKIYVNVTELNPKDWIETIVHEILHLMFMLETKNSSHTEMENFIDKTFVEHFGDIFPNYRVQ